MYAGALRLMTGRGLRALGWLPGTIARSSTEACAEAVPKLTGAQRPTTAAAMIRTHTHGLERRAATKLI